MGSIGELGKLFILLGIVILLIGLLLIGSERIPYIGRLPGDIFIKKKNFMLYIPLATSVLISIILTLLFNLFRR